MGLGLVLSATMKFNNCTKQAFMASVFVGLLVASLALFLLDPAPAFHFVSHFGPPPATTPQPVVCQQDTTLSLPSFPLFIHNDSRLMELAGGLNPQPVGLKKIALMFLTRGALPFGPLWDKWLKGYSTLYSIYVHAPPGFVFDSDNTPHIFIDRQIPSKPVYRGRVSLVEAERRLLAQALLDPANAHFVVLSEACVPIQSFITTYSYITGTPYSFVQMTRQHQSFVRCLNIEYAEWREGMAWFVVDRELALAAVGDTFLVSEFVRCDKSRRIFYPDQAYFQILFRTAKLEHKIANRSMMHTTWHPGTSDGHPVAYARHNTTLELLHRIQNRTHRVKKRTDCIWKPGVYSLCNLFARKFRNDTLELFMASDLYDNEMDEDDLLMVPRSP